MIVSACDFARYRADYCEAPGVNQNYGLDERGLCLHCHLPRGDLVSTEGPLAETAEIDFCGFENFTALNSLSLST
ncbi:hypothetical protein FHX05_005375 [Rhizobium sp. BK491]|nr:hypothetical protein [Rhizobium sp. BK491]